MRASAKLLACVCLCLLALPTMRLWADPPTDAKVPDACPVVHVLLVIDTNAAGLGDSVGIDGDAMNAVLQSALTKKDQLDLKRLDGDNATPDKIKKYYQDLKETCKPEEAVAFFYTGRGATINHQPTLTMSGGNLSRQDLFDAMKATKGCLVVCITDCRGNVADTGKAPPAPPIVKGENPLVDRLFLQSRGVVDVTGSTLDSAMGDTTNGGFFTRSLCKVLRPEPGKSGDEALAAGGWAKFFDKVKQETADVCSDYAAGVRAHGGEPAVENQIPFAWSRGDDALVLVAKPTTPTTTTPHSWRLGLRVFNNNNGEGVRVGQVVDKSPAQKVGFEVGDVLIAIDGKPIKSVQDFTACIDGSTTGHIKVVVRNVRTKQELTVPDVALEAEPMPMPPPK